MGTLHKSEMDTAVFEAKWDESAGHWVAWCRNQFSGVYSYGATFNVALDNIKHRCNIIAEEMAKQRKGSL